MKKLRPANKTYVSPASVEIELLYEGVILADSDVDLGFEFEDVGDMPDGDNYEIGG